MTIALPDNNHSSLVGLTADDHLQYALLTGARAFTGDVAMGTNQITGLGEPSASDDAATKLYVDNLVNGQKWKDPVRVATTVGGVLATAFDNGKTVDGIVLATDDRMAIKNQSTASENGLYIVNASGAPTRTADLPSGISAASIAFRVQEGASNGDKSFTCTTDLGADTVGTHALSFAETGGSGSGEVNTASSVGVASVAGFKAKNGVNLEFNGHKAGSTIIEVTLDAPNNNVIYDFKPTNLSQVASEGADLIVFVDTSDSNNLKTTTISDLDTSDHGSLTGLGDDDHTQYANLNGARAFTGDVAMGANQITGLGEPSASDDAATKLYVDNLVNGQKWKDPVRVATTVGGVLATAFDNGKTVDGIVIATGDRIAIKNQSTASENGLYDVVASGTPTRTADLPSGSSAASIAFRVQEGTSNGDKSFTCTTDLGSDIVGTHALSFAETGGSGSGEVNTASSSRRCQRIGIQTEERYKPGIQWP